MSPSLATASLPSASLRDVHGPAGLTGRPGAGRWFRAPAARPTGREAGWGPCGMVSVARRWVCGPCGSGWPAWCRALVPRARRASDRRDGARTVWIVSASWWWVVWWWWGWVRGGEPGCFRPPTTVSGSLGSCRSACAGYVGLAFGMCPSGEAGCESWGRRCQRRTGLGAIVSPSRLCVARRLLGCELCCPAFASVGLRPRSSGRSDPGQVGRVRGDAGAVGGLPRHDVRHVGHRVVVAHDGPRLLGQIAHVQPALAQVLAGGQ